MKSLEQLDSWITNQVKSWSARASGTPRSRELLEIRREILSNVRDHVEPKGDGKSVFPYNTLTIQVAAQDTHQRNLFDAALGEASGLEQDIHELLGEAGCPVSAPLRISVSIIEDNALAIGERPFSVEYFNTKPTALPVKPLAVRPSAKLTILRGQADAPEYAIDADLFNIGRLKEVVGDLQGLRRRNHLAFAETETTVSREHAYIRYDPEACKFRLYDAISQRGTSIFRDGRRLEVPKGPTRGVQLRSGDEIHVGDARIAFLIEDSNREPGS